jgi:hypothetical protein
MADSKQPTSSRSWGEGEHYASSDRRFAHIVARAWSDEAFKQRLLSNPEEVFAEYKLDLPPGKKVRFVENTDDTIHFVLPSKPTTIAHLSLDRLPVHILDTPCHGHESCYCYCGTYKCHHTHQGDPE